MNMNSTPLMIVALSLQKAGDVKTLAKETDLDISTIYGWLRFRNVPSYPSFEKLYGYLGIIEKLKNSSPQKNVPKIEEIEDLVVVLRHRHSANNHTIMFGEIEGTQETVFIPPRTTYELQEKMGGVIPAGTEVMLLLVKDISGRSDYIAKGII